MPDGLDMGEVREAHLAIDEHERRRRAEQNGQACRDCGEPRAGYPSPFCMRATDHDRQPPIADPVPDEAVRVADVPMRTARVRSRVIGEGRTTIVDVPLPGDAPVPVHAVPPPGEGLMPCCRRPPFEARGDRISDDPADVTCAALDERIAAARDLIAGTGVTFADVERATAGLTLGDLAPVDAPHGEEPPTGLVQVVRHTRRLSTYGEMLDVLDHLPTIVREARRRHGWTGRQMAVALGVNHGTVSHLERGRPPSADTLAAILRWLSKETTR